MNLRCGVMLCMLALSGCASSSGSDVIMKRTNVGGAMKFASRSLPPPVFADPARKEKLAAAFPDIETYLDEKIAEMKVPGAAVGIVVDGELAFAKSFGVVDIETKRPVDKDSAFRIASLTKSFTAMSIMKLRDEGKLSLEDAVADLVPELSGLAYPTRDAAPITIRGLLLHRGGFPEDNPWGDRQLGLPDQAFSQMMKEGFPFSTSPGTSFEYSNLGFAMLGRVVSNVSGLDYADYLRKRVLSPLGMHGTVLDERLLEKGRLVRGYRMEGEKLRAETNLPHGAFGAMGGLYSSLSDLARYVAFHLGAWPARDDQEVGPLRRSSVREMQQSARPTGVLASPGSEETELKVYASGYAFGLGTFSTCNYEWGVQHTGGLPGYGSAIIFLPDHGVGVVALGNLTYAHMRSVASEVLARLRKTGALVAREMVPTPQLVRAKDGLMRLYSGWDEREADAVFAKSFFMDRERSAVMAELRALREKHGTCRQDGAKKEGLKVQNALRGKLRLSCERGGVEMRFTLAPTNPPKIQYLAVKGSLVSTELPREGRVGGDRCAQ